jgi:hemerythrin
MGSRAWDEGLGTGVGAMDTEHRLQVSLVNTLEEILRRDQDLAAADRTLDQLVDFSNVHFHSEELMMRLYSYPQYELHAQAHAKLLDQLRSIRERYDRGARGEALEIVTELRGWLVNHIRSMDQAFAVWLARSGMRLG